MPITTLIKGIPPSIPIGFCLTGANLQAFVNEIFKGTWQFQSDVGNSFYNWGATTPSPENRIFPWFNSTDGRWYQYTGGAWVSPYTAAPPGPNGLRWEWEGTLGDLATFDGGNANPVTSTDGPFWEEDVLYQGRSSMGAIATLPVSGTPFTVGTNAGEEKHLQTLAEMASHTHTVTPNALEYTPGSGSVTGILIHKSGAGSGDAGSPATITTDTQGSSVPANVIHPVRSNYKIKRTSRQYYSIP